MLKHKYEWFSNGRPAKPQSSGKPSKQQNNRPVSDEQKTKYKPRRTLYD